ncbi:MAG: aminotransferase class III-fold pyridoxal phosphate-dependent enzyme, partial [Candidatus Omnitrophica bacterium]|nr:aminotransferase class III-fold pyridoxal phosphate-dependent enzyme [Candidatus Omnitrophota bacterium]
MTSHKPSTINDKLFRQAKKYLVGGVNSPVRSFRAVGGKPLLMKKGKGAKVYDYQGNRYIDYVLTFGAAMLGHAHPAVTGAVVRAAGQGFGFGTTHKTEITLAAAIQQAIPFIRKIRFTNSGTEAVMGAIRVSRGFTGKAAILKFANS